MIGLISSGSSVSLPEPLTVWGEASRHRWLISRFILFVRPILSVTILGTRDRDGWWSGVTYHRSQGRPPSHTICLMMSTHHGLRCLCGTKRTISDSRHMLSRPSCDSCAFHPYSLYSGASWSEGPLAPSDCHSDG